MYCIMQCTKHPLSPAASDKQPAFAKKFSVKTGGAPRTPGPLTNHRYG